MRKIVLIGPKGVGKTTIGLEIIKKYNNFKFIDLDIYLHEILKFPRKNTYDEKEFFKKKELEIQILEFGLKAPKDTIISTGSGLLINQFDKNIEKIKNLLLAKNLEIVLILPDEDNEVSKKILQERNNNMQNDEIEFYEDNLWALKNISTRIIYSKDKSITQIASEIVDQAF